MQNRNIFFLIVIIFFAVGFFLIKNNFSKNLLIDKIQYIEIAGKKELKKDEGMLFVFNHTGKYPFWMKDMNFPIDIIWIGEDLRVVYIKKDAKPESYPETFTPNQDAKYVLEVFSSFSEKNNLKEGDRVKFLSS